eukprot:1814484-Pleurochrysis_carterae.AAC.1
MTDLAVSGHPAALPMISFSSGCTSSCPSRRLQVPRLWPVGAPLSRSAGAVRLASRRADAHAMGGVLLDMLRRLEHRRHHRAQPDGVGVGEARRLVDVLAITGIGSEAICAKTRLIATHKLES